VTEFDTPRRHIFHQGLWDGTCFLYAIANAYKALTRNKVTRQKWDRAAPLIPNPLDFLGGVGATALSNDDATSLIEDFLEAFSEPGERVEIDRLSRTASTADIGDEISPVAVVLFGFSGPTEVHHPKSHIVCGVSTSAEPALLHLACSAAMSSRLLRDGDYFERFHPSVGRYSNDSIRVDGEVRIAPDWRWRLTLAPPGPP
jgi:hypothetical protein